jgi:hypothetical protein
VVQIKMRVYPGRRVRYIEIYLNLENTIILQVLHCPGFFTERKEGRVQQTRVGAPVPR